MSAGIILLVVAGLLVVGFVAFYRYSRTEAWEQSETRRGLLNVIVAIGPLLGMHHRAPRPPLPGIMTPGPEPEEDDEDEAPERSAGEGHDLEPGDPGGDQGHQLRD